MNEDHLTERRMQATVLRVPLPSEEEYDAAREFVDRQTSLVELR